MDPHCVARYQNTILNYWRVKRLYVHIVGKDDWNRENDQSVPDDDNVTHIDDHLTRTCLVVSHKDRIMLQFYHSYQYVGLHNVADYYKLVFEHIISLKLMLIQSICVHYELGFAVSI